VPVHRLTVYAAASSSDGRLVSAAHQLNVPALETCIPARLFFLEGELSTNDADRLARELLTDPVTERYTLDDLNGHPSAANGADDAHYIEVTLHPGVTDPVAENIVRSAHLIGINALERAATGQHYRLSGSLDPVMVSRLATQVLSNPVIQRVAIDTPISAPFVAVQTKDSTVEIIPIRGSDDDALKALSAERRLSLDLNEMRAIRDYFDEVQRDPTDAELELLAQTWSEHCVHKTFKAKIDYTGPAHGGAPDSAPTSQQIDGLLKTYLRSATEKLNKDWVRSAFVDNAGIIRFDDQWDIAFKVETHNRPSALEPFGGANTGVGGVIRDVLGVSARPIANTDILCFGLPETPVESLPEGVLHPRRIADGVIAGIEDYGNKMGIPTVNGAIVYHPGYTSNPLVFCGCIGILPHGAHRSQAEAGDLIVVVGGRTGRDGLRGATFSSMEMDTSTAEVSGGAVQIGHPIMEKQVQEVVLRARDEGLYTSITDCGAGGLSSAVGEMGAEIGATVRLETVPLKYPGLRPWEIWLSEAQERMVLAVPPENWERLLEIAVGQDVEAVVIGTFDPTGRLTLTYDGQPVGDLSMQFLHDGIPQRHLKAEWTPSIAKTSPAQDAPDNLTQTLLQLLALPTIRSKEDVIRRYDHEVQTGTALKPLVGVAAAGPGDATVLVPLDTIASEGEVVRGVALSNGLSPQFGEIDPYAMAWAAVDEAVRNLVAVGADPDQIAILDNFCWGNTQLPDRLGSLVRCAQGCYDAALAYSTPYISGKDSLNNEYIGEDGQRHAIPGTLVISAVGTVPDVAKTVSMDLKAPGNMLFLVGQTQDELGGSHYHLLNGIEGGTVPQPVPNALDRMRKVHQAIQSGLVQSCHDLSEGGLAVALAEMSLAGRLGVEILVQKEQRVTQLFSESLSRFVVEVRVEDSNAFRALFAENEIRYIGRVSYKDKPRFIVRWEGATSDDQPVIQTTPAELERAWRSAVSGVDIPNELSAKTNDEVPPAGEVNFIRTSIATIPSAPRILILHANGTNRDRDAALACRLAGGDPEVVHVNQLLTGERQLLDYHMLVIPGGFSYGDDLGAGVLWALDLRERLADLDQFVDEGRPVLGICNGFQTLVKAGLLGLPDNTSEHRPITLTYNERGHFECRWVHLLPNPDSPSLFIRDLNEPIFCPIAHGEGRVAVRDDATLQALLNANLNALTYVNDAGTTGEYPVNPNGSVAHIAALTNAQGNVFGLMPHPENHIFPWQNPLRYRGASGGLGLRLFENGIRAARGN
jgi:phosphoribosylformylglycinamidine synthase II/phosphoribosylformylglycinamidine synthase I